MRPQPSLLWVRRPRGLAILAALASAALGAPAAQATHIAGATYNGTHGPGPDQTVTLTVSANGSQVSSFEVRNVPGTSCTFTSSGTTTPFNIVNHAFNLQSANGSFFRGTFVGQQAVNGTLREFLPGVPGSTPSCDSGERSWSATTTTPPPPACSDGMDNDGDGQVDLADPGCANPGDPDEADPPPPPPPPPPPQQQPPPPTFGPQPPFGPQPGFPQQQPGPGFDGPDDDRQVEQASCRRSGRYRGRTSQGMRMCFTLSRNRRRISQFEFNWRADCEGGRIEALTEVGRRGLPRVSRSGRFRIFGSSFSLEGRVTRRAGRGVVEISTSGAVGDCESGRLRWSARRG